MNTFGLIQVSRLDLSPRHTSLHRNRGSVSCLENEWSLVALWHDIWG